MIVRAPVFVYPESVYGFFRSGTPYIPDKPNYKVGNENRKCRFADLVLPGTDIRPNGQETGVFRYNCLSYFSVRKPSYLSLRLNMAVASGASQYNFNPGSTPYTLDNILYTDFTLTEMNGQPALPKFEQVIQWFVGPDGLTVFIAIGSWFQLWFLRGVSIGGDLYRHTWNLTCERECRLYVESVSDLDGSPSFGFANGGQSFPVLAQTPAGVNWSLTQGGLIFRGSGENPVAFVAGRTPTATASSFTIRADIEVPYGL